MLIIIITDVYVLVYNVFTCDCEVNQRFISGTHSRMRIPFLSLKHLVLYFPLKKKKWRPKWPRLQRWVTSKGYGINLINF